MSFLKWTSSHSNFWHIVGPKFLFKNYSRTSFVTLQLLKSSLACLLKKLTLRLKFYRRRCEPTRAPTGCCRCTTPTAPGNRPKWTCTPLRVSPASASAPAPLAIPCTRPRACSLKWEGSAACTWTAARLCWCCVKRSWLETKVVSGLKIVIFWLNCSHKNMFSIKQQVCCDSFILNIIWLSLL